MSGDSILSVVSTCTSGFPSHSFQFWTGRARLPSGHLKKKKFYFFPQAVFVREYVCLFHLKLVDPPIYEAAHNKMSACKQRSPNFLFFSFSFINYNIHGDTCTQDHKTEKLQSSYLHESLTDERNLSMLNFPGKWEDILSEFSCIWRGWISIKIHEYENACLTATTANCNQAGQIKQAAIKQAIYIKTGEGLSVSDPIVKVGAYGDRIFRGS